MIRIEKNKKGFTLIELLVVVAIIGILAAIAIPQFSKYRVRAYNSAAQSDLRNVQTAFESYFADYQEYPNAITNQTNDIGLTSTNGAAAGVDNMTLSHQVSLTSVVGTSNATYAAVTKHAQGDRCYETNSQRSVVVINDNLTNWQGQSVSACGTPVAP